MATKKGALEKIAEAVGDAVEAVAVNVGLSEPDPEHKPKAARKAERKARVAEVEETKKSARKARRASL